MSDLFTREEQRERDARMAASVTSYGVGTRSYNSSTEAREAKRQRAEATERYAALPRKENTIIYLTSSANESGSVLTI